MPTDPLNEGELIELNQVTTEVLARLPQLRVIDKVTVVRDVCMANYQFGPNLVA